MKDYNHKMVLGLLHSCQQLSIDPQDKGMDINRLRQIIEILTDCGCKDACQTLLPGFRTALRFWEVGNIQGASVSLSVTTEKIGILSIPKKFLVDN